MLRHGAPLAATLAEISRMSPDLTLVVAKFRPGQTLCAGRWRLDHLVIGNADVRYGSLAAAARSNCDISFTPKAAAAVIGRRIRFGQKQTSPGA
jgi:hypothetical protein